MSEFKPLHDVSKSGRMAFAAGPEGECVAVFDLVRWQLYSGAACSIREAIDGALGKLHEAIASGCMVYQASPAGYWAQPLLSAQIVRQEIRGGWVDGAPTKYLDILGGDPVWLVQHSPGKQKPYQPPLVGPAGAVELLSELLAKCSRLDTFDVVTTTHKAVPHFGIAQADAVALFGYPRASTGEAQVGVSQTATSTDDKAESTHEAAVATLEDRVIELYDSGVLSPSKIVRCIGLDSWPNVKPDTPRTDVSRMIARHLKKKAKAIEERQKAAGADPFSQLKAPQPVR